MSFYSKDEAKKASIDTRMEVVYATINKQLSKPDRVNYINRTDVKDPYIEVTLAGAPDKDLLDRIKSELEEKGWHRVAIRPYRENDNALIHIKFYRDPEDKPVDPVDPTDPEPGLGTDEPVPEYVTEPELSQGDVSAKGQTDGKMLIGTGNPITDFSRASNGEIELALAARRYRNTTTFAPVDGVYQVELPATGDWNWPYSIALIEEARPVTELYDVVLTLEAKDTQKSVPFTLSRDEEGVYHFINEEFELDIKDNAASTSGDVLQNIQRARFYEAHLGEIQKSESGAPLGNYSISLKATRKVGEVAPVELTVNVVVTEKTE